MTTDEKSAFITELCNGVRDTVLSRIGAMPEAWDGHEIRDYLAGQFDRQRGAILRSYPRSRRTRDFNNEILVNSLL